MAKGAVKQSNKTLNKDTRDVRTGYGDLRTEMRDRLSGAQGRADETYNAAFGGLEDFLGGAGRRGGGYDSMFRGLATNPLAGVDIGRVRGSGVFDEFAKTGGLDEAARGDLRNRASSTVGSFYAGLKDELDRSARSSGYGGGPGFDAQSAKLARQGAQSTQQALLDAETDIIDRVTAGRQWGAGNVSQADQFLADLMSRNKIAGMQGGASFGANYDRDTLAAIDQLRGLRTDQPGEEFGLYDRLEGNLNDEFGMRRGLNQDRMAYNPNRGVMDYVGPLLQGGVSALATAYGGPAGAAANSLFGGGADSFGGGQTVHTGVGNRVQMPTASIRPRNTMVRF